MADYSSIIRWKRDGDTFSDKKYHRQHTWSFDGGAEIPASSSPHSVPVPYSNPACVDPEEALIAAVSSCHMLWFLSIACARGFVINSYQDNAMGQMGDIGNGRQALTFITLHPKVSFNELKTPGEEEFQAMHVKAHENCFIANSVKSEVRCIPEIVHD